MTASRKFQPGQMVRLLVDSGVPTERAGTVMKFQKYEPAGHRPLVYCSKNRAEDHLPGWAFFEDQLELVEG